MKKPVFYARFVIPKEDWKAFLKWCEATHGKKRASRILRKLIQFAVIGFLLYVACKIRLVDEIMTLLSVF